MLNLSKRLSIIMENDGEEFFAAVAIVKHKDRWLLGLSTSDDDRNKKWCFCGGGIETGETPQVAAAREAMEETGIKCTPVGPILTTRDRPGVAFVPCRAANKPGTLTPNSEFSALGWFKSEEFKSLILLSNVRKLVNKAKTKF